jgi:DNA-binding GntR family transcriptional regulator
VVRETQGLVATVAAMLIDLDRQDVPKHIQLADYIRERIDDGTYEPRVRIPSEAHWVEETGFARDTVRKALALLMDEGRLYIVRGLGTFVSPPGP